MDIRPMENYEEIPERILDKTWVIQYNPNCPKRFCIRFPGKDRASVDLYPDYATLDRIGYGNTVDEAVGGSMKGGLSTTHD